MFCAPLPFTALGKDNGLQSGPRKAFFAVVQGVGAGLAYGAFSWAYYPDKMAFAHKDTVIAGPIRGSSYVMNTLVRPTVAFSVVNLTYAGVESVMEEIRGSHHKDPWNSAFAGAAAGFVLGSFLARRFDVATCSALGTGLIMGALDFNGPNIIADPESDGARKFPAKISAIFQESDELKALKEKYPAYKNN